MNKRINGMLVYSFHVYLWLIKLLRRLDKWLKNFLWSGVISRRKILSCFFCRPSAYHGRWVALTCVLPLREIRDLASVIWDQSHLINVKQQIMRYFPSLKCRIAPTTNTWYVLAKKLVRANTNVSYVVKFSPKTPSFRPKSPSYPFHLKSLRLLTVPSKKGTCCFVVWNRYEWDACL